VRKTSCHDLLIDIDQLTLSGENEKWHRARAARRFSFSRWQWSHLHWATGDKIMWIASRPNAFFSTLLVGLIAGFFLGAHAVTGSNATAISMAAFTAVGAVLGAGAMARRNRARCEGTIPMPACPLPATYPRLNDGNDPSADTEALRRRRTTPPPPPDRVSAAAIDDAETALRNLGFSVREARSAVAGALSSLDARADAATIVKAALRSGRA
jgi:hypothetical protein